MVLDESHHYEEEYETVSIRDLLKSVRRQRSKILLSIAVIVLLLAVALISVYLFAPSERIASLAFRLEFQGAENRQYPSGVQFTTADIVATPVLRLVYERNGLERFIPFDDFSQSVYVVEENEMIRQLTNEYRARLADPKLSAVDRERLEQEFEQKKESIARNSYALQYAADVSGIEIPNELIQKVLRDILETWAKYARDEKGAVRYEIPAFSVNILPPVDEDPIVALDMLRSRILDILRNIETLRSIPGADALRTEEGLSLAELELKLDDVIRLYIRPLVNEFRSGQFVEDRASAIHFVESQLSHVRIRRDEVAARVGALKEALELYTEGSRPIAVSPAQQQGGETVMPQFGDSFLDRIVDLAGQSADRQYRQNLVDEISEASLELVPYETEIEFYEGLLQDLRTAPVRGDAELSRPRRTIESTRERVVETVLQANEIYELASENLNASRLLYTITGPVQFTIARSVSVSRLGLIGLLVLLVAIPAVLILAIVLDRANEDELEEARVERREKRDG